MAVHEEIVTQIDTETGKPEESVLNVRDEDGKSLVQGELKIPAQDLEIEVQDDTPKKDRGRKPLNKPAELATDNEAEIEGVLKEYDEKNQTRIKDLRHAFHDTRRLKEAVERERDEAINVAKHAFGEVERLKKAQAQERINFVKQLQAKSVVEVAAAKQLYKQAYESGDAEALTNAQEALSKAQINHENLNRWRPPAVAPAAAPLQTPNNGVYNQPQVAPAAPNDPDAEAWARENTWFGDPKHKRMTSFAYGVHEELIQDGINPIEDSDKYYARVNEAMRETFPNYEWGDGGNGEDKSVARAPVRKETRTATVVAPVQRTTRGTKVTLTTSQVSLAKRLGLTPEQYARELVKTTNGVQ
jgi:hypothetical protein